MPATPSGFTLLAFTPRQVLLSNQTMKHSATLEQDQKLLLHLSIARYLHLNGFSKTLKKFRSEAQIEKGNLEGSSIDLEDMCLKYLEICGKDAKSNINDEKEQDVQSKNKEDCKSKEKKKKKCKTVSESLANGVEENQLESLTLITRKEVHCVSADAKLVNGAETEKGSKDKKKKKDKTSSQGDAVMHIEDPNDAVPKKDKILASNKYVRDREKKDSKKRKRSTSEENDQQVADRKEDEEPKRRKVEDLNESEGGEKSAKTDANLGSVLNSNKQKVGVSSQVGGDQSQKTSNEQTNGKTNGNLESAGEKSSVQKSQKKQQMASVESQQKTVKKPFQRVQVEKVEFVDERLQDNSYWAKDGAESGYGAKADEILSQVRGRDFRHEKTKKKRGTYRGGQIDLQSHSVKFNYSDEE